MRLRDVDPSGRFGLASWSGAPLRVLDLRKLRWLDVRELPGRTKVGGQDVSRITSRAVVFDPSWGTVDDETPYVVYSAFSLRDGSVETVDIERPTGSTWVADDHVCFVSDIQRVHIIDPQHHIRSFSPLPRKVLQAVYVDIGRGLMASGTFGEICVHRIAGDDLVRTGHAPTPGKLTWLQTEGRWLAAIVDGGVIVWSFDDGAIGERRYQHSFDDAPIHASLSRDGRYLAVGAGKKLMIHDLDNDIIENFDRDHTDTICLVRFAGADNLLVSADDDHRVILRPRSATGHARTKFEIELPSEAAPLVMDAGEPLFLR